MRDWARVEGDRPVPHRFAARNYEDMGAIDLAAEAAARAVHRGPRDPDAGERLGRLRQREGEEILAVADQPIVVPFGGAELGRARVMHQ